MTAPALRMEVRGLSKAFALHRRVMAKGIATDGVRAAAHLLRQTLLPRAPAAPQCQHGAGDVLLALDGVSFDVRAGEVLGIIGRNGAGKTTLLRILARVLTPTAGRVTIRGRVVSMLELGIGFASDLTLRQNLQLYGTLAGVSASRIRAVEGQILDLAGLAEFRDRPLGECPSGSFVRLGFSAMITLDTEIVLADEVLAVGDSAFRQVCEQRIRAVARTGQTVLFVSHDMNAIRRCCTRAIWLDRGRIRQTGPVDDVVDAYTSELLAGRLLAPASADGIAASCRLVDLRLLDAERAQIGALQICEPSYVDCVVRLEAAGLAATVQIELWQGKLHVLTSASPPLVSAARPRTIRAGMRIPPDFLNEGGYQARCRVFATPLAEPGAPPQLVGEEKLDFSVINAQVARSVWADWPWGRPGAISPRLSWVATA